MEKHGNRRKKPFKTNENSISCIKYDMTHHRLSNELTSPKKRFVSVKKKKRITITSKIRSNSFIYSSSSSDENSEDEQSHHQQKANDHDHEHSLSHKLEYLNLHDGLPSFVKHIKKPRRLTFGEIRSLHVSEKFVHEAHKMIFYPPNLAFAPKY